MASESKGWALLLTVESQLHNALFAISIKKAFVNDHLRGEKKAAIFHAEMERISDTLFDFDHSVTEAQ